ncbi:cytochrome P450 [Pilaira anomala]|nr:cytochrome P450 [Pilaira anomala]
MSLIHSILTQEKLDRAITLYDQHVVPRMTHKNKVIAISTAITLSIVVLFREKILKPPRKLRHIPHINPLSIFRSILTSETYWGRSYRKFLPLVDAPEHKGLYLDYGRAGWEVYVCNPEIAKQVLLKHELFPKIPADDGTEATLFSRFIGGPNILILNGHAWRSQRKVINPAFHRSMPVKLFGKLTQEMFKAMETMETTINVSDMMERWTLEAIGRAGFGFKFNAILDRDSKWVHTYNSCNIGMRDPFFFLLPKMDQEYVWLFPKRVKIHRQMDSFFQMLDNVIEAKSESLKKGDFQNDALEENEKDILTLMIESVNRGEGYMSNEELRSNLLIFFIAGHDTTANALAFAIHYLAKYPEIQERAREEALAILGDEPVDVLPTIEETKQMTYINQVIKETLRINGPLPILIPRIAQEDTDLSGTFIPKGTAVNVGLFNMHHSEKVWRDSKEFDPDRFAENRGENSNWLPFGHGGRQCIGMNFSLAEQRVMLSMLLRKFTWSAPKDSIHKDGVITRGYIILGPHELDITFKKRY